NLPPFFRRCVDAAQDKDAGVVHEDVDGSEDAHGFGDHAANTLFVGDLGGHEQGLAAGAGDRFGHGTAGVRVAFGDDDGGAFFGEEFAGRLADAGAAAGDNGDF